MAPAFAVGFTTSFTATWGGIIMEVALTIPGSTIVSTTGGASPLGTVGSRALGVSGTIMSSIVVPVGLVVLSTTIGLIALDFVKSYSMISSAGRRAEAPTGISSPKKLKLNSTKSSHEEEKG